jgi:hypothetical protein
MAMTNSVLPSDADFARMETELFGRLEHSHARKVRKHRLVAVASVLLLSTAGVAGVTEANGTVVNHAAYCYQSADTSSQYVQGQAVDMLEQSDGTGATSRQKQATLAEQSCGLAWSTGSIGNSATVPTLQACVRNDQVFAVFPKDNALSAVTFCTNLGLSAP